MARRRLGRAVLLTALALTTVACAKLLGYDARYRPTPDAVVDAMLRLAGVGKNDVVYDLGSGDGRIVITAAREFGARGVGIEIDPWLVLRSMRSAEQAGVAERVRFVHQDLFESDLSPATVVTLFLSRDLNARLLPKLRQELRAGTRIVSHQHDMGDWRPDRQIEVEVNGTRLPIYLWVVGR
jgi:hypothetical protein